MLNDAIVAAALELRKRDRARRKVIFIVSRWPGIRQHRQLQRYSESPAFERNPGVRRGCRRLRHPGIRPTAEAARAAYGLAAGLQQHPAQVRQRHRGRDLSGFSRDAIEDVYARTLGDARNQYTLGYLTHSTPSSTHREIEVRVARPDLKVTAKEGYYPVGLAR